MGRGDENRHGATCDGLHIHHPLMNEGVAESRSAFASYLRRCCRGAEPLGLNPTQVTVVMQVCDFWWDREWKPYPGKAILAERRF